jgi:aminopeptidase N
MKTNKLAFLATALLFIVLNSVAQPFTKSDYQHGKLNPMRTCFDVNLYEITLKVNPSQKYISGKNQISFTILKNTRKIQLDLFASMQIDSILYQNKTIPFERDSNAFFISFNKKIKKGSQQSLTVFFSGRPLEARKAPWDGGFVWSKDTTNNPFVGLACEGIGVSCWLPCKDHLSDEAESMLMHLQVPSNLIGVSNGKLLGSLPLNNGYTQYDWAVSYPINNYNITVNIANYAHIHDEYRSPIYGILNLDYYVLKSAEKIAQQHFVQVKTMMSCFEKYFGPYPFWNDGYKLVETPYWGMEHQSCVAYGNNYQNNKFGFDFIIVHESGHEWFGNSLSMNDPAEMWIHESFTTYSESIFQECLHGKERAYRYILEQKKNIKNQQPIIGYYDVYYHGRKDNDIYYKGAWMLETMRYLLDNDTLWFNTLYDFATAFKRQNVSNKQVMEFFNNRTRHNWSSFFEQYLFKAQIPVLEYSLKEVDGRLELKYRLVADVKGLEMPVKVNINKDALEDILANSSWQIIDLAYFNKADFKIDAGRVLIQLKELK